MYVLGHDDVTVDVEALADTGSSRASSKRCLRRESGGMETVCNS